MDACLPDWNTDVEAQFPLSLQRKPIGLENELVELLWQNGEIVLNSQTNRKQKQIRDPNSLIEDDETSLWMDCPMDESFEKDICSNFLSDIPSLDESHKQNLFQEFAPPAPTPPRFQHHHHLPIKKQAYSRVEHEGSGMTRTSHCASNQVVNEVDMSLASSSGIGSRTISAAGAGEAYAWKVSEGAEREAITSCSGGSGTSLWKTSSVCNDTNRHKRKSRDESECPSDGTESELAAGNKATRRSRVAEVHNLSERRRRDRINEKMRALQELIPHANKSDKASMLDEAIEYMKSLQLQIQFMWMARGMAPMMLPGMQHYMSRVGMGIGPPVIQPQAGHNPILSYQNQMQNSRLQEQYANYMAFNQMHNSSPQATNMFNFGFHSAQSAPQSNGNRPVG